MRFWGFSESWEVGESGIGWLMDGSKSDETLGMLKWCRSLRSCSPG